MVQQLSSQPGHAGVPVFGGEPRRQVGQENRRELLEKARGNLAPAISYSKTTYSCGCGQPIDGVVLLSGTNGRAQCYKCFVHPSRTPDLPSPGGAATRHT